MICEAETEHKPQTQITINMAGTILSKYILSKYLPHFLQICFEQIWDKKTNGQRQTHNNIAVKQVLGEENLHTEKTIVIMINMIMTMWMMMMMIIIIILLSSLNIVT